MSESINYQMKKDQEEAWGFADKGIFKDQAGQRLQALAYYQKAIKTYQSAIHRWSSVNLNTREQHLLEKWIKNQTMCVDRKNYLEKENSRTIPSPHNDPDIQFIS